MPVNQPRYNIGSPVPGGVMPSGTEEVANAAMNLASTIGQAAEKVAVEFGAPAAAEKGANDGSKLSWKRIPASGEVARAYNNAAIETHNKAIEQSIDNTGNRIALELKTDAQSFQKFPELFRKGTDALIAAVPQEQREAVARLRDSAMEDYVTKLKGAASDIAVEQVGAAQEAMLEELRSKLVSAAADGDKAKVARYSRDIDSVLSLGIGQGVRPDATGKEVPVSIDDMEAMMMNPDGTVKTNPDGTPIDFITANKVQFKTRPTIKLAEAFKYRSKVREAVRESAVLGEFRREADAGRAAQYALSFRKNGAGASGIDPEAYDRIATKMMREVRGLNAAEDRSQKQLDKMSKEQYEAKVANAIFKMQNPDAGGYITTDEFNAIKADSALSPEAFEKFSTRFAADVARSDSPKAIEELDNLLASYETVQASSQLDGFARLKQITGSTYDVYTRRIREKDEEIQKGPLSSPRVKQVVDTHEAYLAAALASGTRSEQRKASRMVNYWSSRLKQSIAYETSMTDNPNDWSQIAERTASWFRDNLGSFTVMQSFRQLDTDQTDPTAMRMPVPPGASRFLTDVSGKRVFNTAAYAEDLYAKYRNVGKGCMDPANAETCGEAALAAEEWERLQSVNPEVDRFLKSEKDRLKKEREQRQAAKTNP